MRGRPPIPTDKTVRLGERIRSLRVEAELTQAELGAAIGTSQRIVSKIEKGDKLIDVFQAVRIAKTFNITLEVLCEF